MAIVWDAEFVTEWSDPNPKLLVTGRGFRKIMELGQSIPMGRGRLEYYKSEDGKLMLRRLSTNGNETWPPLALHVCGRYKVGSKFAHYVVGSEEETDPIKRILREMEIPIKTLRPFEGSLELELSTSGPQTCEWHYSHHEAYFTDGQATDNMTERYYRQGYSALIKDATCVVVVRNETEPVWSQTEYDKVNRTRETDVVVKVYVTNNCKPEKLREILNEADKSFPFRISSLLSEWGLDPEILTFSDELVLDLDNDVLDVDFREDTSGSRDQLVYTDGQDEIDLEPQGLQDRHRITGASVVIVLGTTLFFGGHETSEIEQIYLNKAELGTFEKLLKKANQEHTFDEHRLEEACEAH